MIKKIDGNPIGEPIIYYCVAYPVCKKEKKNSNPKNLQKTNRLAHCYILRLTNCK